MSTSNEDLNNGKKKTGIIQAALEFLSGGGKKDSPKTTPNAPKAEESKVEEKPTVPKAPEPTSEPLGSVFAPKPGTRRFQRPNPLGG